MTSRFAFFRRSCCRFRLEQSNNFCTATRFEDHFFLDQLETHRNHGKSEENVYRAQNRFCLIVPVLIVTIICDAGHEVTEANRAECNEGKITRFDERPMLPVFEPNRSDEDIDSEDRKGKT